ncbi:hypothetical protein M422DRAFT_26642 [Sphaerobolus stellatus SS14]|nr:hypothetical protein M422DRAFT_26642 [Sphaerobolus stellatus SS14]
MIVSLLLLPEPLSSRASAREKLTRLTKQQFSELSTDVYDELMRRNNNKVGNEVPFLPLRQDFHPKRNQARQKLATLPIPRFRDLAGDVYFELCRRYPEFKEPEIIDTPTSAPSAYGEAPSPEYRDRSPPPTTQSPVYSPISPILNARRNPSREQNSPFSDRRRPSEDTLRSPDRSTPLRRPSGDDSGSIYGGGSVSGSIATATSGVIIPNKSTITEEEITVPFERREERTSRSTVMADEKDDPYDDRDTEDGASVGFKSPSSPPAGLAGLNALSNISARTKNRSRESDDDLGPSRSGDSDYNDRSYRSPTSPARNGSLRMRQPNAAEEEKQKREYELKIATMQTRINNLEDEVSDSNARRAEGEDLIRKLTDDLEQFRNRAEDQSAAMLALRRELDDVLAAQSRDQDRRRSEDEDEIQRLKARCEELESERDSLQGAGGAEHTMMLIDQLRSDLETFSSETRDLSRQNEELMTARDSDSIIIRDLNAQMREYKRKYEQAKTELRSVKATSQLYHQQAPKVSADEQLPVGPSGGLLDIHVTAFVSAIDLLLAAGRASTPTRVLAPMKVVINAVHAIIDDVEKYEVRARRERLDIEIEDLQILRERAEMTLSNLTTAAKTHATSLGMSPVSLLDAAASHVASTITEIGKAIHIRKATKSEQDSFGVPGSPTMNNYASQLRTVDDSNNYAAHLRTQSSASSRADEYGSPPRNGRFRELSPPRAAPRTPLARRPPSEPSSSMTSSPPALFDNGPPASDGSAPTEQGDDAWLELKPYLEAQSESIKYAIQSVLSAVRSPAPAPHLNENLTQIITIVSSIVAVCKDSLPVTSAKEGNDILRELSDHCNKLSEIHAQSEITKESRQAMAKSSFAIANAMKSLVKM